LGPPWHIVFGAFSVGLPVIPKQMAELRSSERTRK
jgi:hypothetical protein